MSLSEPIFAVFSLLFGIEKSVKGLIWPAYGVSPAMDRYFRSENPT